MKILTRILSVLMVFVFFFAFVPSVDAKQKSKLTEMSADEIIDPIIDSDLQTSSVAYYDKDSDPNELLGKPNQYTSKVDFADSRIKQYFEKPPIGGTIEVFKTAADAKKRYKDIIKYFDGFGVSEQYLFLHENVLMRIENNLTEAQAKEYDDALVEILENE